jgi:hypothetical protein
MFQRVEKLARIGVCPVVSAPTRSMVFDPSYTVTTGETERTIVIEEGQMGRTETRAQAMSSGRPDL